MNVMNQILQSSWFWPSNHRSKRPKPSYYEDSPIRGRWRKRRDVYDVFFLILICIVYIFYCLYEKSMNKSIVGIFVSFYHDNIFWSTRLYVNRIVDMMLARNICCVTVTYLPFQTLRTLLSLNVFSIFLSGRGKCWSITLFKNWKTVPPCIELPWVQQNSITSFCVGGVEKIKSRF